MARRDTKGSWSLRALIIALVAIVSFGLFGLGVLLSETYGAAHVARNASELHKVNETLGAAGITRAAVAQAVFFSFDDVASEESTTKAITEAESNLAALAELLGEETAPSDVEGLPDFMRAGEETVSLAAAGESGDAESLRLTEVEPAFTALQADLIARQHSLEAAVADSDESGGRIARITFVAIAFAIPAITMIVFWLLLRRRVQEREQLMQARLDAERVLGQAKDEFIAGLSHELRTPLTTIVGFSELLAENESLDVEVKEQLGLIHASSSDLSRMVGDLLVAARLEADALTVSPEVVDLAVAVEVATANYLLNGQAIKVHVPSIEVYADPLHLRQIINNLVSNAHRHGGDRIAITATEKGGSAVLVVADDGPGVPSDVEPRLFKRFVHEGRQALLAGSVGLGLAISQELARRMGGALHYQRAGDWTTFALKVPLVPRVPSSKQLPALSVVGDTE